MRTTKLSTSVLVLVFIPMTLSGCDGDSTNERDAGSDTATDTDTGTDTVSEDDAGADAGEDSDGDDPWAGAVDAYWGNAPDLETRVALFEDIWQSLADDYPCFATFGIDWDAVHDAYLPEIQTATSYGRFAQLLMDLSFDLRDPHTYVISDEVCRTSILTERPPIDMTGSSASSTVFGACVAPTADGSLVVYRVDPSVNPLSLEVGDEIIGYDGASWSENLAAIDASRLPPCGRTRPIDSVLDAIRLASVLMNGHLFSSLEIRRAGETEVESVDLPDFYGATLADQQKADVLCTGQLPIEGVEFPITALSDIGLEDMVTWGFLSGTDVGYIYVYEWLDADAALFEQAVEELWDASALIIDQRFNLGGRYTLVDYGLPALFSEDTPAVDYYIRDDSSNDYEALTLWFESSVDADPETYFDKPIAVLTGPDAMSGGDLFPYVMGKHPRVRRFGAPTAGGFGSMKTYYAADPFVSDFTFMATESVMVEPTTLELLEGHENTPDVPVRLTREDIAAGVDTVVETALAWIEELI